MEECCGACARLLCCGWLFSTGASVGSSRLSSPRSGAGSGARYGATSNGAASQMAKSPKRRRRAKDGELDSDDSDDPRAVTKAFVVAKHPRFGYLVLKAFKESKGLHGQLPGGKVEPGDPSPAHALAREILEETGLDLEQELSRLRRCTFQNGSTELKRRAYFRLELRDSDGLRGSRAPDTGEDFRLELSSEHVGYMFEQDPIKVAESIALYVLCGSLRLLRVAPRLTLVCSHRDPLAPPRSASLPASAPTGTAAARDTPRCSTLNAQLNYKHTPIFFKQQGL
jgi:8-oxo-dGTP pyrophosphatase MutT (NUDIX family)